MRGRKKQDRGIDSFDHITQACPKMRQRFNPLFVPEIMAWLEVMRREYERTGNTLLDSNRVLNDENIECTAGYAFAGAKVCLTLIDRCGKGWSRREWNEVVAELGKAIVQKQEPETEQADQLKLFPEDKGA